MKKLKIIVLITFVLILTGCDVNYSLDINNEVYKEEITLTFPKSLCEMNGSDCKTYVDNTFNSLKETDDFPDYKINQSENGSDVVLTTTVTHSSLEEFKKNNIIETYYENINITENKIRVTDFYEYYDPEVQNNYNITIHTNKKMSETNSKDYNRENGIYKWSFNESSEDKDIILEFQNDEDEKGLLRSTKKENKNTFDTVSNLFMYVLIGIVVITMAFIVINIFILRAKNKNKV